MASFEEEDNFGTSGSYSVVGSFPKEFDYAPDDRDELSPHQEETKPKILLMGLRRSGKSSILKVVFHKMSPNETLFLESTTKIIKDDISNSSFVQFRKNLSSNKGSQIFLKRLSPTSKEFVWESRIPHSILVRDLRGVEVYIASLRC